MKIMLTKSTVPVNCRDLSKKVASGKIRFDLAIQRRGVWTLEQKQNLIDSILNNYPVPPVYFVDKGDKTQWALDGQQRTRSIVEFINGEYKLSAKMGLWIDEDGTTKHEVAGKFYEELHEDVKTKFNSTNISTVTFKDITEEEITEMFKRLNAGTPFKKIELTRIDMPTAITEFVNEISKHEFFDQKVTLSEKSKVHFADHELILQSLMLFTDHEKDFSGKEIRNFVMEYDLCDSERANFVEVLNYLNEAFPVKSAVLKKTSVPVIIKIASKALADAVKPEDFGAKVFEFITKQKSGSAYNNTVTSGSAKKDNIMKRLKIIEKAIVA